MNNHKLIYHLTEEENIQSRVLSSIRNALILSALKKRKERKKREVEEKNKDKKKITSNAIEKRSMKDCISNTLLRMLGVHLAHLIIHSFDGSNELSSYISKANPPDFKHLTTIIHLLKKF
ncbi:hypothetical protein BDF21DRAFT_410930 [Thamnidium elegans]|nr:hypothetical protein BDF21DRAFT_410930 [Thamnidium elegans]